MRPRAFEAALGALAAAAVAGAFASARRRRTIPADSGPQPEQPDLMAGFQAVGEAGRAWSADARRRIIIHVALIVLLLLLAMLIALAGQSAPPPQDPLPSWKAAAAVPAGFFDDLAGFTQADGLETALGLLGAVAALSIAMAATRVDPRLPPRAAVAVSRWLGNLDGTGGLLAAASGMVGVGTVASMVATGEDLARGVVILIVVLATLTLSTALDLRSLDLTLALSWAWNLHQRESSLALLRRYAARLRFSDTALRTMSGGPVAVGTLVAIAMAETDRSRALLILIGLGFGALIGAGGILAVTAATYLQLNATMAWALGATSWNQVRLTVTWLVCFLGVAGLWTGLLVPVMWELSAGRMWVYVALLLCAGWLLLHFLILTVPRLERTGTRLQLKVRPPALIARRAAAELERQLVRRNRSLQEFLAAQQQEPLAHFLPVTGGAR